MTDWPDTLGGATVNEVGVSLMPILFKGEPSGGSEPNALSSTREAVEMLPGPTLTASEAGTVGVTASPSITVVDPIVAWARKPIAFIAARWTLRRSVSNGIAPG